MELIKKIKHKRALAKRDRSYRQGQLPWQLEGVDRSKKEYFEIKNANSILIITVNPSRAEMDKLNELYRLAQKKAVEVLILVYLDEGHLHISEYLPKNLPLYTITDENINMLGEIQGVYMSRLQSKTWDIGILLMQANTMATDYLLYISNIRCIISQENDQLWAADVQYPIKESTILLDKVIQELKNKK